MMKTNQEDLEVRPVSQTGAKSPKEQNEAPVLPKDEIRGADKDNNSEISSKENEATQNIPQPEVIQPSRGSGLLGGFCC